MKSTCQKILMVNHRKTINLNQNHIQMTAEMKVKVKKGAKKMQCKDCAYINPRTKNGNCICSFLKIKFPFQPGLYLKNENEKACSYFRKKE